MATLDDDFRAAVQTGDAAAIERLGELLDANDADKRRQLASTESLVRAALWYGRHGWMVFPCVPGEKRPATRHGLHDATNDDKTIWEWWTDNPTYNIGVRTGLTFDVIDIDGHTGFDSLRREPTRMPETLGVVATPRRPGVHHYVRPTGRGNKAGLLPGIDYRGAGGYVVAPPSRTDAGMYVWTTPVDLAALTTTEPT